MLHLRRGHSTKHVDISLNLDNSFSCERLSELDRSNWGTQDSKAIVNHRHVGGNSALSDDGLLKPRGKALPFGMSKLSLKFIHIEMFPSCVGSCGSFWRANNVDVVTVCNDEEVRKLGSKLYEVRMDG